MTYYPLNLQSQTGYALANDVADHVALTALGYLPAYVDETVAPSATPTAVDEIDPSEADSQGHTVESVRAALDAAGIAYDKRLGLAKLLDLLPPTS